MVISIKVEDILIFGLLNFLLQRPKPAAQMPSSVLDPTCVSLKTGSVTETKTALTALTRALKRAAVSSHFSEIFPMSRL